MNETKKVEWIVKNFQKGFGVDLGCGPEKLKGTFGVDIRQRNNPDLVYDCSKEDMWNKIAPVVDYIYSSHLVEDFVESDQIKMCKMWANHLKKGGYLMIYVPEKGAYKGINLDHKREFERGFLEKLFIDSGIQHFFTAYESDWSNLLYGVLGVGIKK